MTTPSGQDSLDRLRAALEALRLPGLISAYAFGSVPEGRAHRESDLDVGILLDRGNHPDAESRFAAQLELRRHLTPATVGRDVDVVVLNDAPPPLGRRIVRGERVYCMDAEADHAFQRDVQLRAADLAPFLEKMRRLLHASLSR